MAWGVSPKQHRARSRDRHPFPTEPGGTRTRLHGVLARHGRATRARSRRSGRIVRIRAVFGRIRAGRTDRRRRFVHQLAHRSRWIPSSACGGHSYRCITYSHPARNPHRLGHPAAHRYRGPGRDCRQLACFRSGHLPPLRLWDSDQQCDLSHSAAPGGAAAPHRYWGNRPTRRGSIARRACGNLRASGVDGIRGASAAMVALA